MNYNPYYFTPYITQGPARVGIFSSLFRNTRSINWSSILNGTQKALNIANQAIPVIKQVTPMMQNAKTMFKVMNEFKRIDSPAPNTKIKSEEKDYGNTEHTNTTIDYDGNSQAPQFDGSPTFFVN